MQATVVRDASVRVIVALEAAESLEGDAQAS